METINLYGAGGHAKVVMDIIVARGDNVGCLYDDSPHYDEINGRQVFKPIDKDVEGQLIISIGSCKIHKLIAERYCHLKFATAIHPQSIISDSANIEEGTVVMPGAIINADAKIGKHCIVNTNASIDHECVIGNFVHIAPGVTISGNVNIGECTWIGAGSVVKQGVKIGRNCMIGAGSVVVKDIPDNVVAYGNPCKVIHGNDSL